MLSKELNLVKSSDVKIFWKETVCWFTRARLFSFNFFGPGRNLYFAQCDTEAVDVTQQLHHCLHCFQLADERSEWLQLRPEEGRGLRQR